MRALDTPCQFLPVFQCVRRRRKWAPPPDSSHLVHLKVTSELEREGEDGTTERKHRKQKVMWCVKEGSAYDYQVDGVYHL
jgi:hypothetical protein